MVSLIWALVFVCTLRKGYPEIVDKNIGLFIITGILDSAIVIFALFFSLGKG